uniref:Uncharacterized protein n=1 Tax=Siphoviridae sp. ctqPo10 TaxID=2827948 RepID=A0A8S5SW10_9CAUD|nr:MAG TPA: hypothetical protein [Siphoviridae sp. ctqPo10]
MGKLTLEEAIVHAKEVAEKNYRGADFESIDSVDNDIKTNCIKCAEEHEQLAEWLKELRSYKGLEEQGLLVRLPCKVGDTVWDNDFGYPESYEIKAFSYGYCDSYVEPDIEDEIIFYYENYTHSISITGAFPMSEIGKTVFLTREEAEKKLEEMKNNG